MSTLIPSGLLDLVQKRGKIWSDFDNALKDKETLHSEGNKVKGVEVTGLISDSLSGTNIPPIELSAALYKLKDELKTIDNIKTEIEQCEKDIQDEEARIRRNKTIAIIVAVVLVWIITYAALHGLKVI